MFDATTGRNQRNRRSATGGVLSILLHAGVFGAAFAFLVTSHVIEKPPEEVEITFFSEPPPPPPPPPPPATKKKKKKKKKKKPKVEPVEIQPEVLVQPEEIPEDIPETDEDESDEDEDSEEYGVEGGVEGGVVGGLVGGVVGGVVGGTGTGFATFGVAESKGRALSKPRITYPEEAKMRGVEGRVQLKILVDVNGKVTKNRDDACAGWHSASKEERRTRWHPMKCIQAVAGPEMLYWETIQAWSAIKWKPYKSGEVFTRYWVNVQTDYKLIN